MPAPKTPNAAAAAAARRLIGLNAAAKKLRAAGWIVAPPGVSGAAEAIVDALAELAQHVSGSELAALQDARTAVEQFRSDGEGEVES